MREPGLAISIAQLLKEDLDIAVGEPREALGFRYFLADLSPWHLNLSDSAPFVSVTPANLEGKSPVDAIRELESLVLQKRWREQVVFVVLELDEAAEPEMRHACSRSELRFVMVGRTEAAGILSSAPHPTRVIGIVTKQLGLSVLSPYEVSAPVVGARFFDRQHEVRTIAEHPATNYLVLGVRRIGKTSLLLETKRSLDRKLAPEPPLAPYFACNVFTCADDFLYAIATELDIRSRARMNLERLPHLLKVASHNGHRRLTLFLDEVDALIRFDRERGWRLLNVFKASTDSGHCRYIMAGFREAEREAYSMSSPIFRTATTMVLKSFTREETRLMVETPMSNLGVSFRNAGEVVGRIQEETGGHPNFVQYYCHAILGILDRTGRREVSPDDLPSLYNDEDFKRQVCSTFETNATAFEKVVVYTFCRGLPDQFTVKDVYRRLTTEDTRLSDTLKIDDVTLACEKLALAGILSYMSGVYRFSTPALPRLLSERYDVRFMAERLKVECGLVKTRGTSP